MGKSSYRAAAVGDEIKIKSYSITMTGYSMSTTLSKDLHVSGKMEGRLLHHLINLM